MPAHSVYKPPNEKFVLPALGHGHLPHIVIRDFVVVYPPCYRVESDLSACGPPATSDVTPMGSVHISMSDNVVRMWVQLKR